MRTNVSTNEVELEAQADVAVKIKCLYVFTWRHLLWNLVFDGLALGGDSFFHH